MDLIDQYHQRLLESPQVLRALVDRRVSLAAMRVFGLGYFDASELSPFYRRIMFPVRDPYGNLMSFQGRATYDYSEEDKPKYYHSPFDKAGLLYGLYECARRAVDFGALVLVEGPMDVLALYDAGLPAVALMGSTFSPRQAWLVRRYARRAIVWMDADVAGERASALVEQALSPLGVETSRVGRHQPFKDASETWERAGFDGMRRTLSG